MFPLLEEVEIRAFILSRNFPAVLIIFTGRGEEPPLPRGAGRPSLLIMVWSYGIQRVKRENLLKAVWKYAVIFGMKASECFSETLLIAES